MTPDAERYAQLMDEARRWLKAEAGIEIDPDDPSLLSAMIALQAIRMQENRFENIATRAVERASEPLRENMQSQISILQKIATSFEDAAGESRQLAAARTALVSITAELSNEMKPLHSNMALTRQALEHRSSTLYSPALLAIAGLALTIMGVLIGLLVAPYLP